MGAYLQELVCRSSYARERLRDRIKEPSVEIALNNLKAYTELRPLSPEELSMLVNMPDVQKLEMLLVRFEQWYLKVKAPEKVRMEGPWDWFPRARQMRRRFIFHAGPTNSGKTHEALEKLMSAKSGVYCAPLKALAAQVWRTIDTRVPCDLLIGDERQFGGSAEHVSCTTEMTPIDNMVDVGVIDEIQMIDDSQRGWAWTRALLGLPAKEIHLCGEARALSIVRNLLYKTNEARNITIRSHERLVPLRLTTPLRGGYNSTELRNGDCIVVFGRKKIFEIQDAIEESNRQSSIQPHDQVATHVIYGGLPFAVREHESDGFNRGVCMRYDEDRAARGLDQQHQKHQGCGTSTAPSPSSSASTTTPFDPTLITEKKHVLITTDAIAYGLNMNIRRIILTATKKFDGKGLINLPQSTVLQVAGRAGRYGLKFSKEGGSVTTLHERDLHVVEEAFEKPLPQIERAGLLPTADIIAIYADLKRKEGITTFTELMKCFVRDMNTENTLLFPCDMSRSVLAIAAALDGVHGDGFDLKDRVIFCFAPLGDSSPESFDMLRSYAQAHANGGPVPMRVDEECVKVIEASFADPNGAVASLLAIEASTPTASSSSLSSSSLVNRDGIDITGLQRDLSKLEWAYKMVEVYGWLSWRFGGTFMSQEETKMVKERTVRGIELSLRALRIAGIHVEPPSSRRPSNHNSRYGGKDRRYGGGGDQSPPAPVNRELHYAGVQSNSSSSSSRRGHSYSSVDVDTPFNNLRSHHGGGGGRQAYPNRGDSGSGYRRR